MTQVAMAAVSTVLLFVGMLGLIELGFRLGRRQLTVDPAHAGAGASAIDGALFGLLGLLLAFTFSGATDRFDARRQLIIDESNAIGTAWLRVDLLPGGAQPPIRDLFRVYTEERVLTYRALPDEAASRAHADKAAALQQQLWAQAIASAGALPGVQQLVLASLNDMFDLVTRRQMATLTHPPLVVFGLLFAVALVSALFAGIGMAAGGRRKTLHALAFAAVIASSIYVILDIEYPRQGFVRVDDFDEAMVRVREAMK